MTRLRNCRQAVPPKGAFLILCSAVILIGQTRAPVPETAKKSAPVTKPTLSSALNLITADGLRGNLSFLSSDALAGRFTPSPGLDVAAEFIASQFRAAGLEPGGDQDYFQMANMVDRQMPQPVSGMTLREGSQEISVPEKSISISSVNRATKVQHCPVLVFKTRDPESLKGATLAGMVVMAPVQDLSGRSPEQRQELYRKARAFDRAVGAAHAKLEILVGPTGLIYGAGLFTAEKAAEDATPIVMTSSDEAKKWLERPSSAPDSREVSFDVPAPVDHPVMLKNVVGILRGSDPKLKDTCVLLTAHYDHIGTIETGRHMTEQPVKESTADRIFNGANDDGSGTVSVIEIAKALSKANPKPKRSIVFVTFFGEERGDIGSKYYGAHPVFPIAKTVADVNLEQVGRTDSTTGKQLNSASITGFDYSNVTRFLQEAGRRVGINIYLDKQASDDYFVRSDNAALAEQGVPAHSLCVAFDYPDYHGLGDEWQKIDYQNMAKVDRAVALALLNIANSLRAPQWNANNPKTEPFRAAQRKLQQ